MYRRQFIESGDRKVSRWFYCWVVIIRTGFWGLRNAYEFLVRSYQHVVFVFMPLLAILSVISFYNAVSQVLEENQEQKFIYLFIYYDIIYSDIA